MKTMRARLKQRMRKDRPMTVNSMRIPEDVIEDLKEIAPTLGFPGYQPLMWPISGRACAKTSPAWKAPRNSGLRKASGVMAFRMKSSPTHLPMRSCLQLQQSRTMRLQFQPDRLMNCPQTKSTLTGRFGPPG